MNKLYIRLQEIKRRPGLYLGEKSLCRLDAYILGYIQSMQDYSSKDNKLFDGFEEFIQEKYNIKTHSSFQIISFYSVTQEEAFDNFYRLLDEFLRTHQDNLN